MDGSGTLGKVIRRDLDLSAALLAAHRHRSEEIQAASPRRLRGESPWLRTAVASLAEDLLDQRAGPTRKIVTRRMA